MYLTRSDCINIITALLAIKGELGPKARYAIAKDLLILKRVQRDVAKTRTEMFSKHYPGESDPSKITPESPGWEEFKNEVFAYLDTPIEIKGLIQFPLDELNLEKNEIPVAVVNTIDPLLTVDIQ